MTEVSSDKQLGSVVQAAFISKDSHDSAAAVDDEISKTLLHLSVDEAGSKTAEHASPDSRCLFIGKLPKEATESDIEKVLSVHGGSVEVMVKRAKFTKQSCGYGFATFGTHQEAKTVFESCNSYSVNGQNLMMKWAQRNCRIHVGNLDASTVTEELLSSTFGAFGDLIEQSTTIHNTDKGICYGQVHFWNRECAEKAKTVLNGVVIGNKPMHLEWHQNTLQSPTSGRTAGKCAFPNRVLSDSSLSTNESATMKMLEHSKSTPNITTLETDASETHSPETSAPDGRDMTTVAASPVGPGNVFSTIVSIYVKFETQSSDIRMDDQKLRTVMSKYGKVTGVSIKSSVILSAPSLLQQGYAFVHFESSEAGRNSARLAVGALHLGSIVDGVLYLAELSKNFHRGLESSQKSNRRSPQHHHSRSYKQSQPYAYIHPPYLYSNTEEDTEFMSQSYCDYNGMPPYNQYYYGNVNGTSASYPTPNPYYQFSPKNQYDNGYTVQNGLGANGNDNHFVYQDSPSGSNGGVSSQASPNQQGPFLGNNLFPSPSTCPPSGGTNMVMPPMYSPPSNGMYNGSPSNPGGYVNFYPYPSIPSQSSYFFPPNSNMTPPNSVNMAYVPYAPTPPYQGGFAAYGGGDQVEQLMNSPTQNNPGSNEPVCYHGDSPGYSGISSNAPNEVNIHPPPQD